jgi:hypothetical protein
MNTRAFLLSSLIAGVVIGLFGGLPVISLANCVLCIWVWLGAVFAVWLYRKFEGSQPKVTSSQGMLIGLVSGLIGAVVVWLLSLLTRDAASQLIGNFATQAGINLPAGLIGGGLTIIGLFIDLVLYGIFGVVGGLIGASIFKGPAPAPAPVAAQVPPPAPYQAPAPEVLPPAAPEEPEATQTEPPAQDNPG